MMLTDIIVNQMIISPGHAEKYEWRDPNRLSEIMKDDAIP
jgi:hypothetical protein